MFLPASLYGLNDWSQKEARGLFTWPALIKELYNSLLSSGPCLVTQLFSAGLNLRLTQTVQSFSSNHHKESFHEDARVFLYRILFVHLMTVEVSWTHAELCACWSNWTPCGMWGFFIFRSILQPSISHLSGVSHRSDQAFKCVLKEEESSSKSVSQREICWWSNERLFLFLM